MTILCVDDEPTILDLLELGLAAVGGFDVVRAENAADGFQIVQDDQHDIECFLLDIQMPGESGVELCERIRKIEKYKDTPILMLTAMANEDYIEQAFMAGATDYVTKPFQAEELNMRVKAAIMRAPKREAPKAEVSEPAPEKAPEPSQEETADMPTSQAQPDTPIVPSKPERKPPAPRPKGDLISALAEIQRKNEAKHTPKQEEAPTAALTQKIEAIRPNSLQTKNPYKLPPVVKQIEEQIQKATKLSDAIALQAGQRCLAHLTFERYLETMTAHGRIDLHIFSIGIVGIEPIYVDSEGFEFENFLLDAAKALGRVLSPYRSLYSYFGNGIFCGSVRREGAQHVETFPEKFFEEVAENRDDYPNLLDKEFELTTGEPKQAGLFRSPVSRMKSSVEDMNGILFEEADTA